jgi:hypothetical protein
MTANLAIEPVKLAMVLLINNVYLALTIESLGPF